jgi:peptidoglycan/LPS O-acetylase OafA/YrhL
MDKRNGGGIAIHPALSVLLDLTRFLLAFLVLLGHWFNSFGMQHPGALAVAVFAVGAFFVISGFTIHAIYLTNPATGAANFFIDRLTRLWSVALPALALTVACDVISMLVNPGYYGGCCGWELSYPGARILFNALFLNEIWGLGLSPMSNSPFWSMAYEAMFYVTYGLWRAGLPRRRWQLGLLIVLVFGPSFLPFMLLWLAGVLLAELLFAARPRFMVPAWVAALALVAGCLVWNGPKAGAASFIGLCQFLAAAVHAWYPALGSSLMRFNASLIGGALATVTAAVLLLPLGRRLNRLPRLEALAAPWLKPARRIGDATFSLYLIHLPLLVLVGSLAGRAGWNAARPGFALPVLGGVVLLSLLMAPRCNDLKRRLRRWLEGLWGAAPAEPPLGTG